MLFIVKATAPKGDVTWLAASNADGVRTLGLRIAAEVFDTQTDAALAIVRMQQSPGTAGITFSVERVD
jgi:hypothetical protein